MTSTRRLLWAAQALVAIGVGYFVVRGIRGHWADFRELDLAGVSFNLPLLVASCGIVLATFVLLIGAWRTLVRGWGSSLPFGSAAAIWCLSNMGRYIPGKVWAVAGMAILAKRAGVDPLAATGSAVLMQALALGTGVAVAVAAAPGVASMWVVLLVLGVAAATVVALSSPRLLELASRWTGRELRPVSIGALAAASAITAGAWLSYGLSFWLVMWATLGDHGVTFLAATGYFVASYIMGLVFVFAPGGIGVREGVMFSLLAPTIGGAEALVVAGVARLVFTVSELVAVAAVLPFSRTLKGQEQP